MSDRKPTPATPADERKQPEAPRPDPAGEAARTTDALPPEPGPGDPGYTGPERRAPQVILAELKPDA